MRVGIMKLYKIKKENKWLRARTKIGAGQQPGGKPASQTAT